MASDSKGISEWSGRELQASREPAADSETSSVEAWASSERVERTDGVQFPFLSTFLKNNLRQARQASESTDSADSADTLLDRQKSVDSADRQVGRGLRTLDLRALPRDVGPPTELQARREKFVYFERKCSEVAKGVCVGGELVARDRDLLKQNGITHVVNCIGMLCPACFPEDFKYLVLYLNDATGEDLVSLLYDVFTFIEDAVQGGGRVLVHCSQGVSRSATFVIAYLMWKRDIPYDQAYQAVKAIRGVTNPNIGFTCQLLNWAKRRGPPAASYKAYQIMQHSSDEKFPQCLVARLLREEANLTDASRVLIIRLPLQLFIWQGRHSSLEHLQTARRAAASLQRFEGSPEAVLVRQGSEPGELASALKASTLHGQNERSVLPTHQQRPPPIVPRVRLPLAAAVVSNGDGSAPNSARNKTPRSEAGAQSSAGLRSPNQRQRKVRRSDSTSDGPATARSRSSESLEEGEEAAADPPAASLELSKGFSPHKCTPRSSRSTHSPGAVRSPLAAASFRRSPTAHAV